MSKPGIYAIAMSTGGAGDNTTGSCNILNCNVYGKEYYIGIDCGISQGKYEFRNDDFPITGDNINAFIITHAHMDHMGGLAMLKDFTGKIYGTREALTLGYTLIYDSVDKYIRKSAEEKGLSIENYYNMLKKLEDLRKHNRNIEEQKDLADMILDIEQGALYNYEDVERIRRCFCYIKPYEEFKISNDITGMLIPNTHQVGACSVEIYIGEETDENFISVSFSGDIGPKENLLYNTEEYTPNRRIDYAWMESTHGIEEKEQSVQEAYNFLKNRVLSAIEKGTVSIWATFALDRSAKLLYILNSIIDETNVCIPIYWDTPLGYIQLQHYKDFYFNNNYLWFKNLGRNPFDDNELIICNSKLEHFDALDSKGPKIIITSSAFGDGGRINDYFEKYIEDENAEFIFTGWLSPGCPSDTLFKAKRFDENSISVRGEEYIKKCETYQILGLTSHGFYDDFTEYLDRFPNLKGLVLNHGDRGAKIELANKLKSDYGFDIIIPELFDEKNSNNCFYMISKDSIESIPSIEGYEIFKKIF